VREGIVRYVGSSNFAGWQVADTEAIARREGLNRYISAQNHYSLFDRSVEREVIPACLHYDVGVLPYFPLASGILTGKYRRGEAPKAGTRLATRGQTVSDRQFDVLDKLEEFARERGITLLHVAIGGLAAMPAVASVIAGATKPEQVRSNVEAGEWEPTPEDLAALNAIVAPGRRVS
jgi:aryl-alcohol dehydrogenase-like predicted oxidoreductase